MELNAGKPLVAELLNLNENCDPEIYNFYCSFSNSPFNLPTPPFLPFVFYFKDNKYIYISFSLPIIPGW